MEKPTSLDADSVAAEKLNVLDAVTLPKDLHNTTARGQYIAGWQGGIKVPVTWKKTALIVTRRPRRSRRSSWRWPTGAGRACLSTCGPVSGSTAA
jgi:Glucose-6-phosphate dehydrogenase, C-terminal domain